MSLEQTALQPGKEEAKPTPTPEETAEQQTIAQKAAQHRALIDRAIKEHEALESLGEWVNAQREKGLALDTIGRVLAGMAYRLSLVFASEGIGNLSRQVPTIMENHRKAQQNAAAQAEQKRQQNLAEIRRKRGRH